MVTPYSSDKSLIALYRVSRKDKAKGHSLPLTSCQRETQAVSTTKLSDDLTESQMSMNFVNAWRETTRFYQYPDEPSETSTLDTNTLKWKSWSKAGQCSGIDHSNGGHTMITGMNGRDNEPLYQLTKNEFRRLTEQLRDVSWNLSNRFKGLGFNRFKGYPSNENVAGNMNSACLYRSQLAVSNKAFNDDQTWQPYVHQRTETSSTRCKAVSHIVPDRERRPRTAIPSSRVRPKSSSIQNSRTAQDVTWGDYDMLTAEIVQELQQDKKSSIQSKYGEKITVIGKDRKGEKRMVMTSADISSSDDAAPDRVISESSTSGVASLYSDDEAEDEQPEALKSKMKDDEVRDDDSNLGDEEQATPDEDKSDDETIPEPVTPPDKNKIRIPKMNQTLRPERLDAHAIFEGKKDRHRYDFDATFIRQPRYEFNNIFSPALMSLDLRSLAERDCTLELKKTVSRDEAKIMMRCLEFEKLQLATEKAEDSRFSKTRQYVRQKSASTALSRARAQSARNSQSGTRCAVDCTQVVCVGDCPTKTVTCSFCNKKTCNGSCAPSQYDGHTRQPSGDNSSIYKKPRLPRPSSCSSCSKNNNPTTKINQQQLQLGRPKSSQSTYSRARKSVRQTMDLRASTQQIDFSDLTQDYTVSDRPSTAPTRLDSAKSRRGRESVSPHKSYHSQRRVSLTANTIRPVYGVQLPSPKASPKRRVRSAKQRV